MEKSSKKKNLLVQVAKRKAEAQKAGSNSSGFGKFQSTKSGFAEKAQPIPKRGGRNGQGKP